MRLHRRCRTTRPARRCGVYAVKAPGATRREAEVIAHCRKELAGYKVPKQIVFLDALPKSNVGKILRRELRAIP